MTLDRPLRLAPRRRSWLDIAKLLFVLALAQGAALAHAQAHQIRSGGYVLRSSVVSSRAIAPATARAHGIEPSARRAILNVTLQRLDGRRRQNVRGDMNASATDLSGHRQDIELRPVATHGRVSYMGVFDIAPRQVLEFEVVAHPEGSDEPLRLSFRDRVRAPAR